MSRVFSAGTGDWKVARTRRLESLRYINSVCALWAPGFRFRRRAGRTSAGDTRGAHPQL